MAKVDGSEIFGTLNPETGELEYQKATEVFTVSTKVRCTACGRSRWTCWYWRLRAGLGACAGHA